MPGTTAGGLPFPLSTEQVRDGATAIKNLADALQLRGMAQRLSGATGVFTANSAGQGSVPFPAAFSAAPGCVAVSGDSTQSVRIEIINTSTTGFNFQVKNATTDAAIPNAVVRVNWIAVGTA